LIALFTFRRIARCVLLAAAALNNKKMLAAAALTTTKQANKMRETLIASFSPSLELCSFELRKGLRNSM
ncbi:hypothetical protein PMAYCL1PPCAC_15451, partial [Pristionchus mayeri]